MVAYLREERLVLECVANLEHVHAFLLYLHNHVDAGLEGNRMDDDLVVCCREGGGAWRPSAATSQLVRDD